jgi:hypothetical protein
MCPKSQKTPSQDCTADEVLEEWNFQRQSSQRPLSSGRDSCQGANLVDENTVCDRLEILRAAVVPKYD